MSKPLYTTMTRTDFNIPLGGDDYPIVVTCPNIQRYKKLVSLDIVGKDGLGSEIKAVISLEYKFLTVWDKVPLEVLQQRETKEFSFPDVRGVKNLDIQLDPKEYIKFTLRVLDGKKFAGQMYIKWNTQEVY